MWVPPAPSIGAGVGSRDSVPVRVRQPLDPKDQGGFRQHLHHVLSPASQIPHALKITREMWVIPALSLNEYQSHYPC